MNSAARPEAPWWGVQRNNSQTSLSLSSITENNDGNTSNHGNGNDHGNDHDHGDSNKKEAMALQDIEVKIPGLWRYSKTRQLTFWIKRSLRDVVTPDLNVVYEEHTNTNTTISTDGNHSINTSLDNHYNDNSNSNSNSNSNNTIEDNDIIIDYEADDNDNDNINDYHNSYQYPPSCQNIDDTMYALHTIHSNNNNINENVNENENETNYDSTIPRHVHASSIFSTATISTSASASASASIVQQHPYDWILDGDPDIDDNLSIGMGMGMGIGIDDEREMEVEEDDDDDIDAANAANINMNMTIDDNKEDRTHKLGVEDLDVALENMELEDTPNKIFMGHDYIRNNRGGGGGGSSTIQMNRRTNKEKLPLTPKAHNHQMHKKGSRRHHNSKLMVDNTECTLDYLPSFDNEENDHDNGHGNGNGNGHHGYLHPIKNNNNNNNKHNANEKDFYCITTTTTTTNTRATTPRTHSQCSNDHDHDHDNNHENHNTNECILDYLPFEDPLTLEGKFFRLLKLEREKEKANAKDALLLSLGSRGRSRSSGNNTIHENEHQHQHQNDIENNGNSSASLLSDRFKDVLSSEYYLPDTDFDPILDLFQSIPWEDGLEEEEEEEEKDYGNDENSELNFPILQIDTYLIDKLSSFDEVYQEVTNQLLSNINRKGEEIKERMNLVRAIDCDVTNALSYTKEAQLYLRRARGRDRGQSSTASTSSSSSGGGRDGIAGGLQIIEEGNHREKLRSIDSTLKSCGELFEIENSIRIMCSQFDASILLSRNNFMSTLIEMCRKLKKKVLHEEQFLRMDCLCHLRGRVTYIMDSLCKHLDNGLVSFISHRCTSVHSSLAEKWNDEISREYKALLKARFYLHEYHILEVMENSNGGSVDEKDLPNIANSWSDCIMTSLCFEAERCLALALLDPTSFNNDTSPEPGGDFEENLMDIKTKLKQLQSFDEDAASLRSMTKNLLSIRFQFEKRADLLPWVFHKLCSLLTDVIHTYHLLTQWHKRILDDDSSPDQYTSIHDTILLGKAHFWEHCKSLLVLLVQSFVDWKKTNDNESFHWVRELESNHDILKLSHQISYLAREFTEDDNYCFASNAQCDLKEVLSTMFEKYVRSAHVNAMTEIGTMMATDTWALLPIPKLDPDDDNLTAVEQFQNSIQAFLLNMRKSESESNLPRAQIRPWHNMIESKHSHDRLLEHFSTVGNPFTLKRIMDGNDEDSVPPLLVQDESIFKSDLYEKLSQSICRDDTQLMIGTQTALNGVGRWTVRLLTIRKKLPLVSDQIIGVIKNIYDLYLLTVFRLCIGNAANEGIVLGNTKRSDSIFNERFPHDLPPSKTQLKKSRPQSFGRRRQPSNEQLSQNTSPHNVLVSRFCDADIYSPLKVEEDVLSPTNAFIYRAQASLSGMVDLDQIEGWKLALEGTNDAIYLQKRVVASFSCLFVACLFDIAFHTSELSLITVEKNAPLIEYLNQMLNAVQHMHSLCLRLSTMRAIKGRDVVMKVVSLGNGWAESMLNAHCNDYVDQLVDTCMSLLRHIEASPLKYQPSIISETWDGIIESGYLALLEGFAKVYECSTEGRALMSIDLASFSSALPPASPKRGMQYVDMYIKVFYFPPEDILNWINENRDQYHLHNLMTLVSIGAHNQLPPNAMAKVHKLRAKIRNM